MAKSKARKAPNAPSGSDWEWGGYVGGEVPGGSGGRFGEYVDWDGDEDSMKHEAEDCTGPLYDYLGHFKKQEYLRDGHNTGSAPKLPDPGNPGWTGKGGPAQPEKKWSEEPYDDSKNTQKIPGGGARPF